MRGSAGEPQYSKTASIDPQLAGPLDCSRRPFSGYGAGLRAWLPKPHRLVATMATAQAPHAVDPACVGAVAPRGHPIAEIELTVLPAGHV
jgi:hypothetical protein